MQKSVTQFSSDDSKAKIYVENDMPIGVFHDFLMAIKGLMVERMVSAHKEQVQQAALALHQDLPPHESELSAKPDQPDCLGCSKGE